MEAVCIFTVSDRRLGQKGYVITVWALTPDNQLWVNRCFVNGTFTWLEKLSPYHFLNGIENCWKAVESADFEFPITFGAWRRSNFESRLGHIPTFCIYRLICLLSFCLFFVISVCFSVHLSLVVCVSVDLSKLPVVFSLPGPRKWVLGVRTDECRRQLDDGMCWIEQGWVIVCEYLY